MTAFVVDGIHTVLSSHVGHPGHNVLANGSFLFFRACKNFKINNPEEYSSEGLEKLLKNRCQNILFLRSAQGSQYLSDDLRKAGLEIDDIPLYDVRGSDDPRLDHLIRQAETIDIFAFTRSSTAKYLMKRAAVLGREEQLRYAMAKARIAVIGKPTAAELERLGIRVDIMPKQFTFEALLQAVQRFEFRRFE
jgi:uroporphyrinogen-III synthase